MGTSSKPAPKIGVAVGSGVSVWAGNCVDGMRVEVEVGARTASDAIVGEEAAHAAKNNKPNSATI